MSHYHSSSPNIVLKWMKNFIVQLKDIAPQFCLDENEIRNLALANEELEVLLQKKKSNFPMQKMAKSEISKCVKNALASTIALINRLRKDSNWADTCDKALKIHLLPPKVNFDGVVWKQKTGYRTYDNDECFHVINWLKNLKYECRDIGNLHWVPASSSSNLNDTIEKAEVVLNEYSNVRNNYETLLSQIDGIVRKLRENMKAIVNHMKANESWTEQYALLLNIYPRSTPTNFTNFKPVAQLVALKNYIQINFSKTGLSGMNVYSRLQGETDFLFLGYAKRTGFRDPRPTVACVSQTREYILTAVVEGEEVGQPSDVLSITVDD